VARGGGDDDPGLRRLRLPGRRFSPIRNIGLRILIALLALVFTAVIVYLEGDCYRDLDQVGGITLIDAFYYATVSLSTTGYGDITPVCESARLVNVLVITPLRFLFLIVLVGTTVEVLTQRTRDEWRANRWRNNVNDHTVVIGFGVKGRASAQMLVDSGVPKTNIVVVCPDGTAVADATRLGFAAVFGDARREDILREAAVERAKHVIIATNEDDTSVLVTLTVRRLNPAARIVVAVREAQNTDVLRQSGANATIPTAESAGHLMGLSALSPDAGALMEDLLDSGRGLEVVQRPITREELGLAPTEIDRTGQLVLAVVRADGVHRFDARDVRVLQNGDELVVIRHSPRDL